MKTNCLLLQRKNSAKAQLGQRLNRREVTYLPPPVQPLGKFADPVPRSSFVESGIDAASTLFSYGFSSPSSNAMSCVFGLSLMSIAG